MGLEQLELKRLRVGNMEGAFGAQWTAMFGGKVQVDEIAVARFVEPRLGARWTTVVPFSRNTILPPEHMVRVRGCLPAPLWVKGPSWFWRHKQRKARLGLYLLGGLAALLLIVPIVPIIWMYLTRFQKRLQSANNALALHLNKRLSGTLDRLLPDWFVGLTNSGGFFELPWLTQIRALGDGESIIAVQVGGGAHGEGGLRNLVGRFGEMARSDQNAMFAAGDLSFVTTMELVRGLATVLKPLAEVAQSTPFPIQYEWLCNWGAIDEHTPPRGTKSATFSNSASLRHE